VTMTTNHDQLQPFDGDCASAPLSGDGRTRSASTARIRINALSRYKSCIRTSFPALSSDTTTLTLTMDRTVLFALLPEYRPSLVGRCKFSSFERCFPLLSSLWRDDIQHWCKRALVEFASFLVQRPELDDIGTQCRP
jgi:hypothetical protein